MASKLWVRKRELLISLAKSFHVACSVRHLHTRHHPDVSLNTRDVGFRYQRMGKPRRLRPTPLEYNVNTIHGRNQSVKPDFNFTYSGGLLFFIIDVPRLTVSAIVQIFFARRIWTLKETWIARGIALLIVLVGIPPTCRHIGKTHTPEFFSGGPHAIK